MDEGDEGREQNKRDEEEEEVGEIGKIPDDVLIEILVRGGIGEWEQIACVNKHWASLLSSNCECFWQAALSYHYPLMAVPSLPLPWPGPIPLPNNSKTRFTALYIAQRIFASHPHNLQLHHHFHEIVGHTYLFLKHQLQLFIMPPHSGILHGTIIDQFIACGKSREIAHQLASRIWLAVLHNLDDNHHTFSMLKRLAHEGDVFLPFPYTRSLEVQWRVFEKLFTDFRDCFNQSDYYDMLACAKSRFQHIPSSWLGY
ncbi:uncharacterized protein HKW66_Vig0164620 [Vigna angularis]|uniref:F-box domain-containing protein n=2 Tax=Phaseolus angularis TaxID=3914 RepID=A0A8T0JPH2_PHAAN|nr:uncharacterized protein HKW66_Vig0164620 [Vigna angularis]BAT98661.1 hypothetical protein VIGAN_09233100 [Vigna angularis var. angularis]